MFLGAHKREDGDVSAAIAVSKYLTTSVTRGLLRSRYDDVGAAIFVHMYLTTSITRGLLGSTSRKMVMLVPSYF